MNSKSKINQKGLSLKVEYKFQCHRKHLGFIIETCEGGMFEKIEHTIPYKRNANILWAHVTYTFNNSIQLWENINQDKIGRFVAQNRSKLLKRLSSIKHELRNIEERVNVSYLPNKFNIR